MTTSNIFYNEISLPAVLTKEEEAYYLHEMIVHHSKYARKKLIEHNIRLALYFAKKYHKNVVDYDDLVSLSIVGLVKGIDSFKPHMNIKLPTYLSTCVKNEIFMYFRAYKKHMNNISLDEPCEHHSSKNDQKVVNLSDYLYDESNNIETDFEAQEEKAILFSVINKLPDKERKIIYLHYLKNKSQAEIGTILGMSQSYVSRLEKAALIKLKKYMECQGYIA